ncbi:MAG: tol-pal system protein YbgF [Pseudoxanthomonas suwonensis]|nr:tol-pal system protein YbgF [Pseudoxanthomonas suwonensis]
MRAVSIAILCAATLGVAAPAWGQRVSLGERVAALEARAGDNSATLQLLEQVNQLQAEVRTLRGQLEEMQHAQEQARESSRVQYLDLDGRLERLEGGNAPAADARLPVAVPAAPARDSDARIEERAPSVHGDAGLLANGADEADAYRSAFALLQNGKYLEASRAFTTFLERWPAGVYAPNAIYWLGESYYVTQNYAFALEQFQALRQSFPTHDKASGALLKIGMAHQGLRELDRAEADYQAVIADYPGSNVARIANDRLRALRLQRLN